MIIVEQFGFVDVTVAEAALLALPREHIEMVRINFGNQERNVGIHAERGSIADHGISGARETFFRCTCDIRGQAGENHVTIKRRLRRLHHHRFHEGGHVANQPPRTGLPICFSLRTVRRCQRRHLETWMICQ